MVKCAILKEMIDLEYMIPTNSTASSGHPRSSIMASSCGWSIEPHCILVVSACDVYIFAMCVNLELSNVAIMACVCPMVFHGAEAPPKPHQR